MYGLDFSWNVFQGNVHSSFLLGDPKVKAVGFWARPPKRHMDDPIKQVKRLLHRRLRVRALESDARTSQTSPWLKIHAYQ